MKKQIFTILVFCLYLTGVYAQSHRDHMRIQGKHITKITNEENIKIVIDIMDPRSHEQMMKSMNMKMDHSHSNKFYIMITLFEQNSANMISNANIDGKLNKTQKLKFHSMEHGNRFHYGTEAEIKEGEYQLDLEIKVNNKLIKTGVNFKI